jgi:3-oxoacyl-[acyl-carrier protein] reductase
VTYPDLRGKTAIVTGGSRGLGAAQDDVTGAALFLLSDASGWITGATLDIAGGKISS